MTDYSTTPFTTDAEIERLGEGLLACSLERADWTHEAHLAATTYLCCADPTSTSTRSLPGIIRRFNESVGGVNSDTEGYHETITRSFSCRGAPVPERGGHREPLHELVNELLLSPMGRRDWPLRFYSRERLFSVEARRRSSRRISDAAH